MNSGNARGITMMILAMALFTLNDTLIKAAMLHLPLFQAIALRGVMVTILLAALAWATGNLRPDLSPRDKKLIFLRTLCDLGATATFLTALHHMPLANMSAILQMLPLLMTLAATLIYKEKLGWRRLSAIFIGLLGVMLIIKPGSEAFNLWSVLGVISVIVVCARDILSREISNKASSIYIALTNGVAATLMGFAGYFFQDWENVTAYDFSCLASGSLALSLALIVVVAAMRNGDVSAVTPFRYTAMIWAILLGYLFFGEIPDGYSIIGIVLIIGSGLFTLLRESALRRSAKA